MCVSLFSHVSFFCTLQDLDCCNSHAPHHSGAREAKAALSVNRLSFHEWVALQGFGPCGGSVGPAAGFPRRRHERPYRFSASRSVRLLWQALTATLATSRPIIPTPPHILPPCPVPSYVSTPHHHHTLFTPQYTTPTTSKPHSPRWDDQGAFIPKVIIQVTACELQHLMAEVWCLLVRWYDTFLLDGLTGRELQELRILDEEFHEAAKAVLNFKATWKKHQMEEAPDSRRDLGNQMSANHSEAAHKLTKLLYLLVGNRSMTGFTAQLARARNHVVASQLYCQEYEQSLQPIAASTSQSASATPTSTLSHLTKPQRSWTLLIKINQRLRVTSLQSSCGLAQQNLEVLLLNGFKHFYWAVLNYLSNFTSDLAARDKPILSFRLHPSIAIGQTGSTKAAAAKFIPLAPFSEVPSPAFVAVDFGGEVGMGHPVMGATVTTFCGTQHEVIFCKWLTHEITGHERNKMPLPTSFPMHQWEQTFMGMPPLGGHQHKVSDSYGVVDASKVLNWEPIVCIGVRTWRPTSSYVSSQTRQQSNLEPEEPPSGVGQPLFVNNIHVRSFG